MSRLSTFTAISAAMAAASAAFLSAPAAAQEEAQEQEQQQSLGLACIESQYTPEQQEQFSGLGAEMDGGMEFFQPIVGQLVGAITPALAACVENEGWSQQQAQFATMYEMGRLGSSALRAHGTLTEEELARFDAALADPANADVMPAVMRLVSAGMGGGGEASANDGEMLGQFISDNGFEIGFAGTTTGELTTMLLIFAALQSFGESSFAATAG